MAIQIGGTTVIDNSRNVNAGIGTFTALNVPPIPITFSPAIGATDANLNSNIIITFNGTVEKGTGNITLRSGSAGGTAFSTIGVSSSSVSISGGAVTIDPPSNIGVGVTTFVVVDAGAFSGLTTTSINALINTYSFRTTTFAFSSINHANGATAVGIGTNITLANGAQDSINLGAIIFATGSYSTTAGNPYSGSVMGRVGINKNNPTYNFDVSGSGNYSNNLTLTGSLFISGSANSAVINNGFVVLTQVSQSLNFANDAAAAAGGVPLGGLYRNGNVIAIRIS